MELIWFQHAREEWITSRDCNTRFYYTATLVKNSRTRINALQSEDALWVTNENLLIEHIWNYFINMFSEVQDVNSQPLAHDKYPSLNENEWQAINRPFQPKEIKEVLFEMDSCKTPSPDGFPVGFYKKSWDVVGQSLIKFAMDFFSRGSLP